MKLSKKIMAKVPCLLPLLLIVIVQLSECLAQEKGFSKRSAAVSDSSTRLEIVNHTQSPNGADIYITTGTSVRLTNGGRLWTNGDILLSGDFVAEDSSTVVMSGADEKRLDGEFSFGNLVIDGGGSLVVNGNDTIRTSLTLLDGIIQLGKSAVLILHDGATNAAIIGGNSASYIEGTAQRIFSTTASTQLFPLGAGNRYRPISIQASTATATSAVNAYILFGDARSISSSLGSLQSISSERYYRIENQSLGQPLTLTQAFVEANDDDGVGAFNPNVSLRLATFNTGDASWTERTLAASPNTTVFPVTVSAAPFSVAIPADDTLPLYISLGSTSLIDNPLPVTLLSFVATSTEQGIDLKWQTGSEIESAGFVIYKRRADSAASWREIASYRQTAGLRAQNLLSGAAYRFRDSEEMQSGEQWAYRLNAVDLDGAVATLSEIEVETRFSTAITEYALHQNYPNPFNPTTTIAYQLPKTSEVSLKLYDMLGREVLTLINARQAAGAYKNVLNANGLSSGVYFYRLQAGSFVQTKKMMLIK